MYQIYARVSVCKVKLGMFFFKFNCFRSSVRPKFGIGRKYQPKPLVSVSVFGAETFFSETETFFFKNFQKFSNFFMYFGFLGEYEFLKTWNWTQTFKSYLKVTETMTKPLTKLWLTQWLNQWLNQWPNQWQFLTKIPKTDNV